LYFFSNRNTHVEENEILDSRRTLEKNQTMLSETVKLVKNEEGKEQEQEKMKLRRRSKIKVSVLFFQHVSFLVLRLNFH